MYLTAIHTIQYNDTKGVQHAAEPGSVFEFFGDSDRLLELGAVRLPTDVELVLAGFREDQPSLDLQPAIEPMVNDLSIPPLVLQSPAVPLPLDPVIQTPAVTLVAEDTVSAPVVEAAPTRRRRRAAAEAPVAETVDVQPEPAVDTATEEAPAETVVEESPADAAVESTEAAPAPEGEDDLL